MAAAWNMIPVNYTISSFIEVKRQDPDAGLGERRTETSEDIKAFKETQVQMVKSPIVLASALKVVGQEPWIRNQPDQIKWLQENLMVGFAGDSNVMRISMSDTDPAQMVNIVNGVHRAYLKEYSGEADGERLTQMSELERKRKAMSDDLESLMGRINTLRETLETGDPNVVSGKQSMLLTELGNLQAQFSNATQEARRFTTTYAAWALQKKTHSNPVRLNREAERLMRDDPEVAQLERDVRELSAMVADEEQRSKRPTAYLQAQKSRLQQMQQQLAQTKAALRPAIMEEIQAETMDTIDSEAQLAAFSSQQAKKQADELVAQIDAIKSKLASLHKNNTNLEMLLERVEPLREMVNDLTSTIKTLELNLGFGKRIRSISEAEWNARPYVDLPKYMLTAFSGLGGFGVTLLGIALSQFYRRKVESAEQIEQGMGIHVLGVLPPASRAMQRQLTRKYGHPDALSAVLAESIDNVRIQIMHAESDNPPHVIMVTSAVEQEGKSIVASQLAASLARAGRTTLLIDGDVRRPSVHTMFELQEGPGLCSVLRAEAAPQDACQPSGSPNLWVLPGGKPCRKATESLATNAIYEIVDALRSKFEYIIIDSGPVLGQADSLHLGQHVDTTIVAVLRDVSNLQRVYEACDRLRSVHIPLFGIVVNGEMAPQARKRPELFLTTNTK